MCRLPGCSFSSRVVRVYASSLVNSGLPGSTRALACSDRRPRRSRPGANGSRDGGHSQGWVWSAGAPTTAREARALPKSGNAPTTGLEVEDEAGVAEDLKLLADFVADVPIAGMQFLKSRGQGVRILVGEFGFAGEHTRPRVFRPAPPPVEAGRKWITRRWPFSRLGVVGGGADHCTRGACAPQIRECAKDRVGGGGGGRRRGGLEVAGGFC